MAESTREWEQTPEHLLKLAPKCKGPESTSKHCNDAYAQFDTVEKAYSEVWEASSVAQAVCAKEEDKVGWS